MAGTTPEGAPALSNKPQSSCYGNTSVVVDVIVPWLYKPYVVLKYKSISMPWLQSRRTHYDTSEAQGPTQSYKGHIPAVVSVPPGRKLLWPGKLGITGKTQCLHGRTDKPENVKMTEFHNHVTLINLLLGRKHLTCPITFHKLFKCDWYESQNWGQSSIFFIILVILTAQRPPRPTSPSSSCI